MNYFAYGSNLSQEQMKSRCPGSKLIGPGMLKQYKLDFLEYSPRWKGGCADVVADKSSEVWGLVYEVTDEDIKKLDGFEGVPDFYQRNTHIVQMKSGENINAEVYELVNKKQFFQPTPEYLGIILTVAEKFKFPIEYQNYLQKFTS